MLWGVQLMMETIINALGIFGIWAALIIAFMAHVRIGVMQEEIDNLRQAIQPAIKGAIRPYEWDVIDG